MSQAVRAEAEARGLNVFDATCPLVTKVHVEVSKMHEKGYEIVMIGHKGHPEVEGTLGQSTGGMHLVETPDDVDTLRIADPDKLAYVTQTTLSVDDANGIDAEWLEGKHRIGVTAGASAPEILVSAVIERLQNLGATSTTNLDGAQELVSFPLPKGLH